MSISKILPLEPEHVSAIGSLAEETKRPLEEVTNAYAAALGDLKPSAQVQDYLVVLTSKKVRIALRQTKGAELF